MKYSLTILFLSIFLFGCQKENSYKFEGKFLNGTTNKPYRNVVVEFTETIGPKGQRDFIFLGSTKTDSNGCFSFKYTIEENPAALLSLDFGNTGYSSLYQKSGIAIDQNNNMTFYLSDSNTTEFNFSTTKPLGKNEKLRLYTFANDFDTLFKDSQLVAMNNKFYVRTDRVYFYVGVERILNDTAISLTQVYIDLEGDPLINKVNINY